MATTAGGLQPRLAQLNADYARAIDDDRLEAWPEFFTDDCLYKITSADNLRQGLEAGVVYADSRGMLRDRVAALREANVYERQTYRHLVGLPAILDETAGAVRAETPFLVVRIMRDGRMDLFATGRYLDVLVEEAGTLRFRERVVEQLRSTGLVALVDPEMAEHRHDLRAPHPRPRRRERPLEQQAGTRDVARQKPASRSREHAAVGVDVARVRRKSLRLLQETRGRSDRAARACARRRLLEPGRHPVVGRDCPGRELPSLLVWILDDIGKECVQPATGVVVGSRSEGDSHVG